MDPFTWSHLNLHGAGPPSLRDFFRAEGVAKKALPPPFGSGTAAGRPTPRFSSQMALVTN